MRHGLILLYCSMVCGEFIVTKLSNFQASLFLLNGTAVNYDLFCLVKFQVEISINSNITSKKPGLRL
jgi:hypothetical protein